MSFYHIFHVEREFFCPIFFSWKEKFSSCYFFIEFICCCMWSPIRECATWFKNCYVWFMFWSFKVSFDVVFSTIFYTKIIFTRLTKGKRFSCARFFNTIIFRSLFFVEWKNKLLLLFSFLWSIIFCHHITFKNQKGIKIHGAD